MMAGAVATLCSAGVWAADRQAVGDVLAEVRVHGNHTTPDVEVLRVAGLTVGQALDAGAPERVENALRRSGRFEEVEVRKRYRSLTGAGDVALVIIVRERAAPAEGAPPVLRPIRRAVGDVMFMPILQYADGYGFSYGARASFVDVLGPNGRVSVPLTWGGTKRAAVEIDRALSRGPLDRVEGGVSISRRRNPHYELDDDRRQVWAGASRTIPGGLRVGVHGSLANVTFAGMDDRLAIYGADVVLDTRADPVFPRNALLAGVGWETLEPREGRRVSRTRAEATGYVGLAGQPVLSVRAHYSGAGGPLPAYERYLLGGAGTLRGYRAGTFAGDNLAAASAELRVPLSSPLGITRAGISLFTDVAAAYDHGVSVRDARFRYGTGAGVFLLASLFQVNVDVAYRQGGGARLHLTSGFQF
jgi:outer membrane protein assembly factor BamA